MFLTTKHKQQKLAELAAQNSGQSPQQAMATALAAGYSATPAGAAASDAPDTPVTLAPSAVLHSALQQDLIALKALTNVADKISLKKDVLIPKWRQYIDQYRASGQQFPFEGLVRFVIWLLDAELVSDAIEYGDFAIAQQQPMPEGFSRDLQTFLAETVHDWAERQYKAEHSADPYLGDVINRIETRQWIVNEPIVLNKLYKLVALFAEKNNELEKAEKAYLKCVEVNPEKHGVKGKLTALQTRMGKALTFP